MKKPSTCRKPSKNKFLPEEYKLSATNEKHFTQDKGESPLLFQKMNVEMVKEKNSFAQFRDLRHTSASVRKADFILAN